MLAQAEKIERNDDPELIAKAKLRFADCGGSLLAFFAGAVVTTGRDTTPKDAFGAHMSWIEDQRGTYDFTFEDLVDKSWYESAAFQIREIARDLL